MIDISLNGNFDFDHTISGDLRTVSDADSILQAVLIKLYPVLGKYVDEELTDDLRAQLLSDANTAILSVSGVQSIASSSVGADGNGNPVLYFTINTAAGTIKGSAGV